MTVHFIGAGPGAADLLTIRAARLVGESPVCLYAGTYIGADVLATAPPGAALVDTQHLDLDAITAPASSAHEAGHDVARLCSGDPSLYSAIAEQTRRLDRAGVPWDVTPGRAGVCGGGSAHRPRADGARGGAVRRADAGAPRLDADARERSRSPHFARSRATLVLHLAIRRTRELMASLVGDYGPDCPVVVVANAEQPDQLVLRGTLADIADRSRPRACGRPPSSSSAARWRPATPTTSSSRTSTARESPASHVGSRAPVSWRVSDGAVSGCECRSAREVGVIPTWSSPL